MELSIEQRPSSNEQNEPATGGKIFGDKIGEFFGKGKKVSKKVEYYMRCATCLVENMVGCE